MKSFSMFLIVGLSLVGCAQKEAVTIQSPASTSSSGASQIAQSSVFQILSPTNGQSVPRDFAISGTCVMSGELLSVTYNNGSSMITSSAACNSHTFAINISVQNVQSATGLQTLNVKNSVYVTVGTVQPNIQYSGIVIQNNGGSVSDNSNSGTQAE